MKTPLRIFCDSPLGESVIESLRKEIEPHVLVVPASATASVLSSASHSLDGIDIAFGQPDPAKVLASTSVRWLQITSAGYTRYDSPEFRAAAQKRSLIVTNSSHVYDEPCAEHVFAFILAQARQLPVSLSSRCAAGTEEWNWLRRETVLLQGQSVLILGYGAIAERLVQMLTPFHVKMVAFRRKARGDEPVPIVSLGELPKALAEADHVINILPDNAASRNFMNAERLSLMKQGAALYNIGRGTTIDQTALTQALQSGPLSAAWLDVTDPEPLSPSHPLLKLKNCHITPHVAGGHPDEFKRLAGHFLNNFRRFLRGADLQNRIM